jgi:hypothetical protein
VGGCRLCTAGTGPSHHAAILLGKELETVPDPLQPIGRLALGSMTGTERAREVQDAIAAVDAELKRVGA